MENQTHVGPAIEDENSASDQQDVSDAAASDAVDDSQEHIEDVSQQTEETSRPATPELGDDTDRAGAVVSETRNNNPPVTQAAPSETSVRSSRFPISDRLSNFGCRTQQQPPSYTVEFDPKGHWYNGYEIRWINKVYSDGTRTEDFFISDLVLKYRDPSVVRLTQGWSDNRIYLKDFVTAGIPLPVYERLRTKLRVLFGQEGIDPKLAQTGGNSHYAWLNVKFSDAAYRACAPDIQSGQALTSLESVGTVAEHHYRVGRMHLVGRGQLALRIVSSSWGTKLGGTLVGFDYAGYVDIGSDS